MDYTFTPCSCSLLSLWRLSDMSHTHGSVYTLRKSMLSKRVIQHVNAMSQTQTEEVWFLYLLVLKCQTIGCRSFIDWSTFSPTGHFSCEEKGYMKKRFFHLFHSNSDQLSGIKSSSILQVFYWLQLIPITSLCLTTFQCRFLFWIEVFACFSLHLATWKRSCDWAPCEGLSLTPRGIWLNFNCCRAK